VGTIVAGSAQVSGVREDVANALRKDLCVKDGDGATASKKQLHGTAVRTLYPKVAP
jgi:hypothetical protein